MTLLVLILFKFQQAALQGEKSGNTPQEKPGKGSTKKKSAEQKSSTRSQSSTANGSNWNVKQVVGVVVGVICLIVVFAAVVQRKSGISRHTGMNVTSCVVLQFSNQCAIEYCKGNSLLL